MGFTHYWDMTRNISERNFKKLTSDMKKIEAFVEAITEPTEAFSLHHANGENKGVLYYSDTFGFNGDGSIGADHESMHINLGANDSWTFCKTARKPYDLAVCLILISLKYHIRSTRVSSDGDTADWQNAFNLWNVIFPKRSLVARFKAYEKGDNKLDGSLGLFPKEQFENTEKFLEKYLQTN